MTCVTPQFVWRDVWCDIPRKCDMTQKRHGSWVGHDSHVACLKGCAMTFLTLKFCVAWHVSVMWLIACDDINRSDVFNDSFICVTWLIHMCDMTHSHVWHDSFIWLIHMCDMTHSHVWHDSFICVTWLIHMRDMTHSHVWHDSVIRVTWLIHMCAMTLSYVGQGLYICVTWLIHMCDVTYLHVWWLIHTCDMTYSYAWHAQSCAKERGWGTCNSHDTRMNESRHTYEWVTSHIWTSEVAHSKTHTWMSHGAHINQSYYTHE